MSETLYFYCCCCGDGPHTTMRTTCGNCGHGGCDKCTAAPVSNITAATPAVGSPTLEIAPHDINMEKKSECGRSGIASVSASGPRKHDGDASYNNRDGAKGCKSIGSAKVLAVLVCTGSAGVSTAKALFDDCSGSGLFHHEQHSESAAGHFLSGQTEHLTSWRSLSSTVLRTDASLYLAFAAFALSSTAIYTLNGQDKQTDHFIAAGIIGGVGLGMGLKLDMERTMLSILPWTVLVALLTGDLWRRMRSLQFAKETYCCGHSGNNGNLDW